MVLTRQGLTSDSGVWVHNPTWFLDPQLSQGPAGSRLWFWSLPPPHSKRLDSIISPGLTGTLFWSVWLGRTYLYQNPAASLVFFRMWSFPSPKFRIQTSVTSLQGWPSVFGVFFLTETHTWDRPFASHYRNPHLGQGPAGLHVWCRILASTYHHNPASTRGSRTFACVASYVWFFGSRLRWSNS